MRLPALVAFAASFVCTSAALAADTTWTGAAGNALWTDAGNWNNGVPSRTVVDRAIFDNGAAAGGTVTLGTGNSRPRNVDFRFAAGAASYTLSGADYLDNGSNGRTITSDAGMTRSQGIASQFRVANHAITLNGSGSLTIAFFYGANTWSDTTLNTAPWAVNDAAATLTVGKFEQQRAYTITKSGPGKLVIGGPIDFPYGKNGTTFVSTVLTIAANGGTLDLSAATINLESRLDAGESLTPGATYTLVNYANGTLVGNAGFAAVTGAPAGWEVYNDATAKKIVLREIPPLPKGTTMILR